jgi:hypothetical protein
MKAAIVGLPRHLPVARASQTTDGDPWLPGAFTPANRLEALSRDLESGCNGSHRVGIDPIASGSGRPKSEALIFDNSDLLSPPSSSRAGCCSFTTRRAFNGERPDALRVVQANLGLKRRTRQGRSKTYRSPLVQGQGRLYASPLLRLADAEGKQRARLLGSTAVSSSMEGPVERVSNLLATAALSALKTPSSANRRGASAANEWSLVARLFEVRP